VSRRRFCLSLLILCLAAACSCHALAARPAPLVVCFGDSITAGHGLDPAQAYPAYLQHDLLARGYHDRVLNAGVSGNTTQDALARLPQILALHPVAVIVEFGGNDGLRGLPLSLTEQNLSTIVRRLRAAHIQVLLAGITLPPNYGRDYIHQFDQMYRQIAARYHVPLLPMLYAGIYNLPGTIQPDGIHPTAKGSKLIAEHMLPLLLPLLHR